MNHYYWSEVETISWFTFSVFYFLKKKELNLMQRNFLSVQPVCPYHHQADSLKVKLSIIIKFFSCWALVVTKVHPLQKSKVFHWHEHKAGWCCSAENVTWTILLVVNFSFFLAKLKLSGETSFELSCTWCYKLLLIWKKKRKRIEPLTGS